MSKMFIDGTKLMYHPDVLAKWLAGDNFFPLHVEISPSSACNHRCILCCVDYLKHKPQHLDREVFLNLIRSFSKTGVKSFLLAGEGEPLMNKNLADVISLASELKVDSAINTNGVLFTPDFAEAVMDKILWIRFSLQSAESKLYAYLHGTKETDLEIVKSNIYAAVQIKKRKKLPVKIGIQQILLEENREQILPLAILSKELGVDYYTVKRHSTHPLNKYSVPEDVHVRVEDQFNQAKALEDNNFLALVRFNDFSDPCIRTYKQCLGLPFIAQVLADGGLYTCCQHFRMERFCYGNLYEASFEEIWMSERRKSVIKDVELNIDVSKCMTYCRHHNVNKYIWQLKNSPEHINFI
ncbi:MAG: radical SAM protein [Desulfobacterales bacterium]|nr:radical SAM protein [Desulfobacterales bacterium]